MKTLTEFKHVISKKEFDKILDKFLPFCQKHLGLEDLPTIRFVSPNVAREKGSFGTYKKGLISIDIHQRHPADVLRTVAHELTHYKQHTTNQKDPHRGETGSKTENEANAIAAIIMREFDSAHPEIFKLSHID